jgi:hypothetical protein
VAVDFATPDLTQSAVAARLASWRTEWLANSTFATFDPRVDLLETPEATAYPGGLRIAFHLRDGHAKLWKDWFILHVVPSLESIVPGATFRSFSSPEEPSDVPSA